MPLRLDFHQLGLIRRSERIDTRLLLLVADAYPVLRERYDEEQIAELLAVPVQNNVPAPERLREALRVSAYWPPHVLQLAMIYGAPWHSLVEPPGWDDVEKGDVAAFLTEFVSRRDAWPEIGLIRKAFGRKSNHPLPGEQEGQGSLLPENAA